jgi:Big-like domain-containing protein
MRKFSSVPTRRAAALFSASALAATALIATAGSAGAVVTAGGAADPEGRPGFFTDSQGIRLALCTNAVNCEPADPVDPLHGGYFAAEAQAGPVLAIYGIETAEGEDAAGNPNGQAIVANVARFRGDLAANRQYRIQGPWGTHSCLTAADGELDCIVEAGGEAGTPVGGGPVKTFLRRVSGAPAGFLGDLETAGPVTGSPTGFNRVVVRGPAGNIVGQTNLFSVQGQMAANTPMANLSTDALRMGSGTNARPVTRNIRFSSFGTAPATPQVTKLGANPGRFAVDTSACAAVAAGRACNIRVTYTPQNNRDASARLRIGTGIPGSARQVSLQGVGTDTLRARVASSSPSRGQRVGVSKNVSVRFNEAVRGVKKSSFQVVNQRSGNKVGGSVSRVGQTNRYVFNPRSNLAGDTTYRVRLVGGKAAIRDLAGNPLRTKAWKFRTR